MDSVGLTAGTLREALVQLSISDDEYIYLSIDCDRVSISHRETKEVRYGDEK